MNDKVLIDRGGSDRYTPADLALFKQIAKETADETTRRVFLAMGLDPDDPIAAQSVFAMLRELMHPDAMSGIKADASWVRRSRLRTEGMVGKAILTAIGLSVVGALHAAWTGAATFLKVP